MSMLPRLQPRCYYDLVVEVAIVRPGSDPGRHGASVPANRGLARPAPSNAPTSSARLDAHQRRADLPGAGDADRDVAADFTAGEADELRRAMAAWKRQRRPRSVPRATGRSHGAEWRRREYAERIFKQIEGFGEYGFPEAMRPASHCWSEHGQCRIKATTRTCSWPRLLNAGQPMGFYAPAQRCVTPGRMGAGAAGGRGPQRLAQHAAAC